MPVIITKERTRLLFSEYTDEELKIIEDKVAVMDNVLLYRDKDARIVGLEPGMTDTFRKLFPKAKFVDNTDKYWDFARIEPVQHNATPRNQLQEDFIKFIIECANNKQKLAGILSPGT